MNSTNKAIRLTLLQKASDTVAWFLYGTTVGGAYITTLIYDRAIAVRMNWKDVETNPPEDGENCLTATKYGLLEGEYDAKDESFTGYICGQRLHWAATEWMSACDAYTLLEP